MNFIDRKKEMARLERLILERKGGFAAVWGRRRIGKSELLKEWCRKFNGIYTVADQSLATLQRSSFALALAERFPGFADVIYPTWKSLFEALTNRAMAEDWHGPLVMDEFPYWVEVDASIASVLQNWIDGEKSRCGIVCAIAGSVQHMMQGLVLDADSPLYGRVDEKIKLQPISIGYIGEALQLESAIDAVRAYSVWGGVPRYWVAVEKYGADFERALDEQVFDPIGIFHEEPASLLRSELPNAIALKPYLDVIGMGVNRSGEIAGRLGIPATALSKPLSRLMEIGLIKREIPFGESEKNSKKSLYKLADPFCRFWFTVMASRRSIFDSAQESVRLSIWHKYSQQVFSATWEELARSYVGQAKKLQDLMPSGGYWLPAGRWWHKTEPEWDVVSVTEDNSHVLLGEAKWSDRPFTRSEVQIMAGRIAHRKPPIGFEGMPHYVLFLSSVEGIPKDGCICDGVVIVTAEDVVNEL